MKITGQVTGILRNTETGEITKTFREMNHISIWFMEQHSGGESVQSLGRNIYVTDYLYETTNLGTTRRGTNGQIAIGFTEGGVTNPLGGGSGATGDPWNLTFQQRFAPPATDRLVNYVGLTSDTSITNSLINPSHCGVQLTSPCTQTTVETLDIFYRVQFLQDWNNNELDYAQGDSIGAEQLQTYLIYRQHLDNFTTQWPTNSCNIYWNGNTDSRHWGSTYHATAYNDTGAFTYTTDNNTTYSRDELTCTTTISQGLGELYGAFAYGQNTGTCYLHANLLGPNDDPIQNLFGHGPAADKPFFDSGNLPAGDASVAFGGSGWTNPSFPKMYRVNIETSGAIGVADYQLWERNVFGFEQNTYENSPRMMQGMLINSNHLSQNFRHRNTDNTFSSLMPRYIRYQKNTSSSQYLIAIRQDQICLFDMKTETGVRFNDAYTPTFTPTDITDVDVTSGGIIFVADRSDGNDTGGLYKIVDPNGTPVITKIDNTTTGLTGILSPDVLAVGVGRNDRVWIVMDGGLFYSDDLGSTWTQATFVYTDITDDWYRVKQMTCDIEHANDHIGIVYNTGTFYACWYEGSTTTATQGPNIIRNYASTNLNGNFYWESGTEYSYINMLAVSRTQSKWGCACRRYGSSANGGRPARFVFGTTTINEYPSDLTYSFAVNDFDVDENGDQQLLCMITYYNTGSYRAGFYYSDTTIQYIQLDSSLTPQMLEGWMCYVGNGVFLTHEVYWHFGVVVIGPQTGTATDPEGGIFTNVIWNKYGWDGAFWQINNAGTRLTHGTEEDAIDGLTIQFDDNAGAESYSADDYYTVGVVNGVWMDGSTEYEHTAYAYWMPIVKQTEMQVGVLPGTTYISSLTYNRNNVFTWQNVTSGMDTNTNHFYQSGTHAGPGYDRGGRSVQTIGGQIPTVPWVATSGNARLVAAVQYQINDFNTMTTGRFVCGLSDTSVIGTAVGYSSPQFALHFDGTPSPGDNFFQLSVVHSGVTQYVFPHLFNAADIADDGSGDGFFRVQMFSDGSVQYWLEDVLMYTTPAATANPLLTYVIDFASTGPDDTGVIDIYQTYMPLPTPEPIIEFGTPGSPEGTGRYMDNFRSIEAGRAEIYFDGVLATSVGNQSLDVLSAGEYSINRTQGELRYAAADAGKTVTATYNVTKNF